MIKPYFIFFAALFFLFSCKNNPSTPKTNTKPLVSNTSNKIINVTVYATGNTMTEMAFEPNIINVTAGGEIKLKLINEGTDEMMIHNIVFTQKGKADEIGVKAIRAGEKKQFIPDDSAVIAASKLVGPLDSTVVQFKIPKPGNYPFICTYPGHYLKMRGRLIVKP